MLGPCELVWRAITSLVSSSACWPLLSLCTLSSLNDANGALLLTWYLDTYTAANRHSILAELFWVVQLCTHKLACLTVLKVINYKTEPSAREEIFNALFNPGEDHPSRVLEQILNHSHGPTFIYNTISTPFLEGPELQNAVNKIRTVLISIKALPAQGYKRLMDEVGLATRNAPGQAGGNSQQSNLHRNNSTNTRIYQQQPQLRSQLTPQRTHSTGSNYYQSSQLHVSQMEGRYGRNNGNNNLGSYMSNKRGGNGGYYNGGNGSEGIDQLANVQAQLWLITSLARLTPTRPWALAGSMTMRFSSRWSN